MKIVYSILFCALAATASAQVAIGKQSIDGVNTLLDFNNISSNYNGIILPAVDDTNNALSATSANNNGTFLFDKSDNKIKMYENNTWKDLTDAGDSSSILVNASAEAADQQGTIIGDKISNAKGVLVLESADKAMILPKVKDPHTTVVGPYPGMICYDTTSQTLALFDGKVWNYWK